MLRVFLTGDTDDGPDDRAEESFEREPMALIGCSLPRGPVRHRYGGWSQMVV